MGDPCKTPSSPSRPASAAAASRRPVSGTQFNTITADDWKRSIASARRQPNAVLERIRAGISSSSRKTK
jgi:hypothetical protein